MFSDLRFAFRQLVKTPGFTVVALLTLSIGIGSATVVFSAINALLLRPLPFLSKEKEERMLYVSETNRNRSNEEVNWSYADYNDVRTRSRTLEGIWIHSSKTVIIAGKNEPERVLGDDITWDAFALMGVQPILGRSFTEADIAADAPPVALISAELWKRRYGSDVGILDSPVVFNGKQYTIIGVMPAGWRYPDFSDVWTPLKMHADNKPLYRGDFYFSGRALMKPGVTLEETRTELEGIIASIEKEFPATNSGIGIRVVPIREEAAEDTAQLTLLLFGAVMFVFLIACVNVANLFLARAVTRSKEFAIRLALGAERRRVVRQLVTESVLLGLLGGVGGLVVGLWANDAMVAAVPIDIPFWLRFEFDVHVFLFVFGISLLAALVFGLLPALRSTRPDIVGELKEGGRSGETSGPRAGRLRNALVVFEVALSLVLLVGAGLMLRSFLHLRSIDPGFDARNVLTFRTGFPYSMVGEERDLPRRFFADLLPKLEALPGVESAALIDVLPGTGGKIGNIAIEGRPVPKNLSDSILAPTRTVSGGYFSTMRIPLIAGRYFDDALDRPYTRKVSIVDEAFAVKHFGSVDKAIGKRLRALKNDAEDENPVWFEIVGVVGNIRHRLDNDKLHPTTYNALSQDYVNFLSAIIRTKSAPETYANAARETVLAVNREIPIYHALTLEDVLLREVWQRKFFGYLFTVFGGVALFLACVGIYGVMSYNVTQRTQEIGMRMALGAQAGEVIRLVVRRGLALIGWGLGLGFVSAYFLANLLASVLYGVSPHDPPTFATVPLLLASVAVVACWLPTRYATRIDPAIAIRAE